MHKIDKMVVKGIIKMTAIITADNSITVRSDSYVKTNGINFYIYSVLMVLLSYVQQGEREPPNYKELLLMQQNRGGLVPSCSKIKLNCYHAQNYQALLGHV